MGKKNKKKGGGSPHAAAAPDSGGGAAADAAPAESEEEMKARVRAETEAAIRAEMQAEAATTTTAPPTAPPAAEESAAELEARLRAEAEAKVRAELEAEAAAAAAEKAAAEQAAAAAAFRAEIEAKVRAEAEAKIRAEMEAEARARIELEAKIRAEAEAKVRAEMGVAAPPKAAPDAADAPTPSATPTDGPSPSAAAEAVPGAAAASFDFGGDGDEAAPAEATPATAGGKGGTNGSGDVQVGWTSSFFSRVSSAAAAASAGVAGAASSAGGAVGGALGGVGGAVGGAASSALAKATALVRRDSAPKEGGAPGAAEAAPAEKDADGNPVVALPSALTEGEAKKKDPKKEAAAAKKAAEEAAAAEKEAKACEERLAKLRAADVPPLEESLAVSPGPKLFLDFHNEAFRAGDVVKGVAVLVLPEAMRASCVKIRWVGVEKTYWSKGLTAWELAWAHKAQQPLHEAHTIFNKETVLWRAANGSFSNAAGATDAEAELGEEGELPAGGSVFEFEWALPKHLPRSFHDTSHMMETHSSLTTPIAGMTQYALERAGLWDTDADTRSHIRYTAELVVVAQSNAAATAAVASAAAEAAEDAAAEEAATGGEEGGAEGGGGAAAAPSSSSEPPPTMPLPRCARVLHVTENYSPTSEATLPYTSPPLPLNCAAERTEARTYMFGGEQPCAVSVRLSRPVFVPGRAAKVEMNIINGSTRTVTGFTVRLERTVALRFATDVDEKDVLGLNAVERVATKADVVFEAPISPTDSGTGAEVATVAPMDSKFCAFSLALPRSVEGSVTRGKKLSVTHCLHVELKVRGSSPLVVKMPVYVVDALTPAGMADSEAFGEQGGSSVGWLLSEAGSTMLHIAHAAEERRQRAAAMLTWRKKSEGAAAAAAEAEAAPADASA